jgi:phosphoesterase RecJ-like protein
MEAIRQDVQNSRRDWKHLIQILAENQSFVFSTHTEPDADGIGSELALARLLKSMGKQVTILNPSPIRANLGFLVAEGEISVYDPQQHRRLLLESDVFIAFDIGHYSRLGGLCRDLETSSIQKISIDHHPGEKEQFHGCHNYPDASSTGILIYDLILSYAEKKLTDYTIAYPIYAAIMSDTGNFRFNNTDPETLGAASLLVAAGVKPYELYVYLYEDLNTQGRLIVLQKLLAGLQYACDGKLAWTVIDYEEIHPLGVEPDDLHSLSDFIRSIKGVEVGVAITHMAGEIVDISFRSKGHIPINGIAASFGGGGHAFAAGCKLTGDLTTVADQVIRKCVASIEDWEARAS